MKNTNMFIRKLLHSFLILTISISFSTAQQLKWILPDYQWNMQSTSLTNSSLPGSSSSTYLLSNGAYDAQGNLLFYVTDDVISDQYGTTIGTLLPYFVTGSYYPPDGFGGENSRNFQISGEEVAIVPVPGECKKYYVIYTKGNWVSSNFFALYAIVDCSSGSPTVSYPLANNPGVSNAPFNDVVTINSCGTGLAVSKVYNGTDRYLFNGGGGGIARFNITSSGISSGTIISKYSDEPTLFPVSGGSGTASNSELELSPDQQYLAWANTYAEKLCILKLNSSYTKVSGASVAETLANIRGLEFNATSTRIYLSEPTKGVKYYTVGSSGFSDVTGAFDLDNSFLELAKNGRIYGVNSSHRLRSINESTDVLNSVEASPNVNSDGYHVYGVTGRHHLPDQIDGEDYSNIGGDATPTANYTINGNAVSSNCSTPTELFNCAAVSMTLNDLSTNAQGYRIVITKFSFCGGKDVVIHDTGILPYCPTNLKNLPGGGGTSTYLANNTGLFKVTLYTINNCGTQLSRNGYISVSNGPTGANSSFNTNVITKAGQTITIGGCVVPSNTQLTYTDGTTSCGGVGGYKFPMEHSSVSTPNEVGRLNTTFDLSNVSAGIGSSSYTVSVKTDMWDGSTWVSMDSNPNGETITGASTLSLVGLVSYDPLSPWFEAFTNAGLTPNGSIYRITITVSNECDDFSSVQIVKLNTTTLKSVSLTDEFDSDSFDTKLNVYPNPTNGRINFDFLSTTENEVSITISTVEGRVVRESLNSSQLGNNQQSIDLGEFDSGTYFYKMQIDNKTIIGTIIKK